eukprot:NODE_8368_length_685_cov_37.049822_g7746_i0.p1 GENE.NODE_8368_length_685_cov_37.049822_g7746_i0~~NODE_8368_length_685_cov_37.049822_g7746_i0.p1  ORF type:complete len:213 (+),score=76.51 NODE_8368_length_685_cov_37.049822_g7746_i0:55-639(+)
MAAQKVEKKEEVVKDDEVKIEEDDDDDDNVPALEEADAKDEGAEGGAAGIHRQSRNEKKSRKAMQRLGMKPVPGVNRVTIKKAKNILFVISQPDVYKNATNDSYIIFGEAKIEDIATERGKEAIQALKTPAAAPAAKAPEAEDDEEVDEADVSKLDPKDIELVMNQANVSRARAVKALSHNEGDIVNAIMELTM